MSATHSIIYSLLNCIYNLVSNHLKPEGTIDYPKELRRKNLFILEVKLVIVFVKVIAYVWSTRTVRSLDGFSTVFSLSLLLCCSSLAPIWSVSNTMNSVLHRVKPKWFLEKKAAVFADTLV